MADTKDGREKQARDAENRQREREVEEARARAEEAEQPREESEVASETADSPNAARRCARRGCDRHATFVVVERYQEDTGHGTVEAEAFLCRDHTAEESPTNLENAGADYVFRVTPLATVDVGDTA